MSADRHRLGLLTESLVPCGDRVCARRNQVDGKASGGIGDREVGIVENRHHPVHPAVDVALDREKAWFEQALWNLPDALRHRVVEGRRASFDRMNVVEQGVVVEKIQGRANWNCLDVRHVGAADLVEVGDHGSQWLAGLDVLQIDDDVLEAALRAYFEGLVVMGAAADFRILVANLGRQSWNRTCKRDFP